MLIVLCGAPPTPVPWAASVDYEEMVARTTATASLLEQYKAANAALEHEVGRRDGSKLADSGIGTTASAESAAGTSWDTTATTSSFGAFDFASEADYKSEIEGLRIELDMASTENTDLQAALQTCEAECRSLRLQRDQLRAELVESQRTSSTLAAVR